MARRPASDPTTRHPSQLLALAIGAIYTLIGVLGFLVTGFENFAAETDKEDVPSVVGFGWGLHGGSYGQAVTARSSGGSSVVARSSAAASAGSSW
jgi:hypothetical protein